MSSPAAKMALRCHWVLNAGFPTLKLIVVGISCSFDPNWTGKFATCVGDAGCLGVFYVPPGLGENVRVPLS